MFVFQTPFDVIFHVTNPRTGTSEFLAELDQHVIEVFKEGIGFSPRSFQLGRESKDFTVTG